MRARPLLPALCLLLATATAAPAALAQKSEAALAEALFQEGRRLMAREKIDEACPKFEESQRLAPKLGTLLNLATCHDKQGKTGSAWGELTEAISLAKAAGETERVAYARKLLEDVEKRLSHLVVEVPRPVEGQEVKIDGRPIAAAAYRTPLPLDPGEHLVEASAPGHAAWSKKVTIAAGPSRIAVQVPALEQQAGADVPPADAPRPAAPAAPTAPPEERDEGSTGQLVAGLVIGGVGVAGLAVGSVFGVMTFSQQGDSEDHCVETRCDATGVELRDDASTSATVSTVAFAVGGAAVVGGLLLVLTAGGDDDATSATRVTPWIGPGGGAVSLEGAF